MIVFGVLYLAAFFIMVGALATPPHKFDGRLAGVVFLTQFICGLALAINTIA